MVKPNGLKYWRIKYRFNGVEKSPFALGVYSTRELSDLLDEYEKPLFYHLVDCDKYSLEDARYCGDGYVVGSVYDALLMVSADAIDKRYRLMNRVIRARISGYKVFGGNVPPPPHTALQTRKYGIAESEESSYDLQAMANSNSV